MSRLPSATDTARNVGALFTLLDRMEVEERAAIEQFTAACAQGDANALVPWAGLTTDWDMVKGPVSSDTQLPKRVKLLHEVMTECVMHGEGPGMSGVMQLVLNVAYGSDNSPLQGVARHIVKHMAQVHARYLTETA